MSTSASRTPLLDANILDGGRRQTLRPRLQSVWKWRTLLWVLAAWTLVGFFRAADRYFSDPFSASGSSSGCGGARAEPPLLVHLGRDDAGRRRPGEALAPDARELGGAALPALRRGPRAPGHSPGGVSAPLPAPDGVPVHRLGAARRGAATPAGRVPDALRDVLRDRGRDLDDPLLAPLARARAADLADEDARRDGSARGAEDAAAPALPVQHAEQHPAARLPRPRRRRPHRRPPRRPAAPLAPERGERPDPAAQGARGPAGLPGDPGDAVPGPPDGAAGRRARGRGGARPQPDPAAAGRERDQARHRGAAGRGACRDPRAARRRAAPPARPRRRSGPVRGAGEGDPAPRGRHRAAQHARPSRAALRERSRLRLRAARPAGAAR